MGKYYLYQREREIGGRGMNHIEVKVEFEKCEWSRESDDVWRSDCGLLWSLTTKKLQKQII